MHDAPCTMWSKPRMECSFFKVLEVPESIENVTFRRLRDLILAPLGLILAAFGGLDVFLGPFWAPLGSWVPKWCFFGYPPGLILGPFLTPKSQRTLKNMKKLVSGGGLEKGDVTNLAWRGPRSDRTDK